MRLSRRADYALRVLFDLTGAYGCEPVSIRALAERNDVPKRFLEQIMLDLKDKGWVESLPGKRGGYCLAQPPDKITLGQVVRYFDGVVAAINCVSVHQYEPCSQEGRCHFRRVFLQIRNETARMLDNATLAAVYANSPVQHQEVFSDLLISGAGI